MKKIIYIFLTVFFFQFANAQIVGVEKSINAIQVGVLGAWVNNEYRLTNEISLKNEFGMIAGFSGCSDCKTQYGLVPELKVEPRWYYNINKRSSKRRIIKNNSANFVALGFTYIPDWFVISNIPNANIENQISIIPKWGIKRTIANSNFNYELGIGIGKKYYLDSRQWDTTADLLIRIGYTF